MEDRRNAAAPPTGVWGSAGGGGSMTIIISVLKNTPVQRGKVRKRWRACYKTNRGVLSKMSHNFQVPKPKTIHSIKLLLPKKEQCQRSLPVLQEIVPLNQPGWQLSQILARQPGVTLFNQSNIQEHNHMWQLNTRRYGPCRTVRLPGGLLEVQV